MSKCLIHLPKGFHIDCGWDHVLDYYFDYYGPDSDDPIESLYFTSFYALQRKVESMCSATLAMSEVPTVPNVINHRWCITAIVPVAGTSKYYLHLRHNHCVDFGEVMVAFTDLEVDDNDRLQTVFEGEYLPVIIQQLRLAGEPYEIL